ncbi:hypothetical protein DCC85_08085 [Paenibacillus sp. CAA11]|uniref:hypothetical protein n=1 Tax=Paenibacillus sp. CAA11 TaxID=1532905 RepID=UPI000D340F32|nr:hypothetical protein [Paenibacillus sp. CAA11]AWB44186.1 hypothetical protein DCC85_08085 [Paenibacillus sp. CAA11]
MSMSTIHVSKEEVTLVRSWLALKFTQRILERDSRVMEESGLLRSPQVYVEMLLAAVERSSIVLEEISSELDKHQIHIKKVKQDEFGIEACYQCRGALGRIFILWSALQRDLSQRMRAYLGLGSVPINVAIPSI